MVFTRLSGKTEMATVYSYRRCSSAKQLRGDSLARQERLAKAWLERHPKHTLDTSFRLDDGGVSAAKGKNLSEGGDLGKFIAALKAGKIAKGSILLLESIDRFSRLPPSEVYGLFCALVKAGLNVVTLSPEAEINAKNIDDTGTVIGTVIAMQLAFEENRKRTERVKASIRARNMSATKNKPVTTACPFWLQWDEHKSRFVGIPEKVKLLRRIYTLSIDGHGIHSIVKALRDDGIKSKRGKAWRAGTIKRFLHTRAVLGEYQPGEKIDGKRIELGDVITDYYPQVISHADFNRVQDGLRKRKVKRGRNGANITNLFSCMVRDSQDDSLYIIRRCGGRMTQAAVRLAHQDHDSNSLSYYFFERSILTLIHNEIDLAPADDAPVDEVAELKAKKTDLLNRRSKIVEAMADEEDDLDELRGAARRVNEKIKTIDEQILQAEQQAYKDTTAALQSVKRLHAIARSTKPEDMLALRTKLRAELNRIITSIRFRVVAKTIYNKVALAVVVLSDGQQWSVWFRQERRLRCNLQTAVFDRAQYDIDGLTDDRLFEIGHAKQIGQRRLTVDFQPKDAATRFEAGNEAKPKPR